MTANRKPPANFCRNAAAAILSLVVVLTAPAAERDLPRLRVSDNHRFLVTADGKPFFWLADTAWWIRQLPPPLVTHYLFTRAQQGYNVIQVHPGLAVTNHAGHCPFVNDAPSSPNEPFWQDVDALVREAAGHGLYVALAPLWGNEYGKAFGTNQAAAFAFGQWIGRRSASQANVLWIVSGEYDAINDYKVPISAAQKGVLNAAARGLRAGHQDTQLMTIHPGVARTSSADFHAAPWLGFNLLQSGHLIDSTAHRLLENHTLIGNDYARQPIQPVLDGEPIYEDTPDAVWSVKHINGPRAGADAVRRKAYWSVFSGACGHTYGHNDVYGFFTPAFPGQVLSLQTRPSGPGPRGDWREALQAPGATQMQHLRRLVESRPFLTQFPDRSLLATPETSPLEHLAALRGEGYAMVYTPTGRPFRVRLDKLSGREVQAWWFDPRTGKSQALGRFACEGEREFAPPGQLGAGNDWVLALDDPARQLPAPGSARFEP
ncbi:MAG: DUF4038 domain-containing protein [Verrucomicrobiales bacterium]|nr:DUF4038 domain-containing protein [Verrucomicrobiales bacterium]